MNIEELKTKYPLLFPNNPQEPINLYGLECGKGWHHLIDVACRLLYGPYSRALKEVEYWEGILEYKKFNEDRTEEKVRENLTAALLKLEEKFRELPSVVQIKQKYGDLRFYVEMSIANDYAWGVIDLLGELSAVTCEECGAPGQLIEGKVKKSTFKTLCETHTKEFYGNV
jgi:hypothetical protein